MNEIEKKYWKLAIKRRIKKKSFIFYLGTILILLISATLMIITEKSFYIDVILLNFYFSDFVLWLSYLTFMAIMVSCIVLVAVWWRLYKRTEHKIYMEKSINGMLILTFILSGLIISPFGIYSSIPPPDDGFKYFHSFIYLFISLLIIFYFLFSSPAKLTKIGYVGDQLITPITKEGENVGELANGYSFRPFSKEFQELKIEKENFDSIAREFGMRIAKEGLICDYEVKENTIFYPMVYFLDEMANPIYMLSVINKLKWHKEKLSWIKLSNNGKAIISISKEDYERIEKSVSYHLLCENLLNKFVNSFIEFGKGNVENSVKKLKGS